jgi:hypothetical protein
MKSDVEVVKRELLSTKLPEERIGWLDKHMEARIYFSRSDATEVSTLEAMKSEEKE